MLKFIGKRRLNYIDLAGAVFCTRMYADGIALGWIFVVAVVVALVSVGIETLSEKT